MCVCLYSYFTTCIDVFQNIQVHYISINNRCDGNIRMGKGYGYEMKREMMRSIISIILI